MQRDRERKREGEAAPRARVHDGTKVQSPGINEEETRSCWSKVQQEREREIERGRERERVKRGWE